MSAAIVIIDTSIFLEILGVPGFAEDTDAVRDQLERWIRAQAALLLPIGVIIETGNHVAQLPRGRQRRSLATNFVEQVTYALEGDSPFAPTPSFDVDEPREWLSDFIEYATQGVGLADASLIKLWKRQRELNPARRVLIWSLDDDLAGYDTGE